MRSFLVLNWEISRGLDFGHTSVMAIWTLPLHRS